MMTKREAEAGIEFVENIIADEPQNTIHRLRDCFPDLAENELRTMALRHPAVARMVRHYRRELRQYQKALAEHKARRPVRA